MNISLLYNGFCSLFSSKKEKPISFNEMANCMALECSEKLDTLTKEKFSLIVAFEGMKVENLKRGCGSSTGWKINLVEFNSKEELNIHLYKKFMEIISCELNTVNENCNCNIKLFRDADPGIRRVFLKFSFDGKKIIESVEKSRKIKTFLLVNKALKNMKKTSFPKFIALEIVKHIQK